MASRSELKFFFIMSSLPHPSSQSAASPGDSLKPDHQKTYAMGVVFSMGCNPTQVHENEPSSKEMDLKHQTPERSLKFRGRVTPNGKFQPIA